ncbi:hypothetical protein [Mycobacterium sp. 852002-51961_SCH5331710]|uniref:hypothetical protein n=1 Tax=Mycobacterium sp. 852002-51961_SCH5331710 TaxID=1834105 RepID=UPI0007FF4BFA|nr:hypothetical protein [Mycobacterium sp. 852002-51961_SCH5331710]OBB46769.1 hypothetical protein A5752_25375 [Mycobacterium sp. 852002-51961_SCH5331710]
MTAIPGVGPQLERAVEGTDPRGILVFEYLPDDLQRQEDSTAAADAERWRCGTYSASGTWGTNDPAELSRVMTRARTVLTQAGMHPPRTRPRPATATERALLAHLGYELPDELFTAVSFPTYGVRRRRWPQLETQEVTTP